MSLYVDQVVTVLGIYGRIVAKRLAAAGNFSACEYQVEEGVFFRGRDLGWHSDGPMGVQVVRHCSGWDFEVGLKVMYTNTPSAAPLVIDGLLLTNPGATALYMIREEDEHFPITYRAFPKDITPCALKPSKNDDNCPKCGDAGEWRTMALVCRNGHGVFIGG